jgi:hypothetical protein
MILFTPDSEMTLITTGSKCKSKDVHLSSYLGPHGAGLLEEDAMDRGLRRYLTARKVRQRQVTGEWTGLLYSLCCGTDHRKNEWQYCPHCVERWHRQRGTTGTAPR